MTKITNLEDFKTITSKITSFSHAYLFNVNSLETAYPYIKDFAKSIILQDEEETSFIYEDISYKIDHDEFDDLYVVNPETIGINNEEINKLMSYMETKSLRENGRRVYIIYGFERLSTVISNKILKFLEEPQEGIYGILLTENFEKILPTIVSRCQIMNFSFPEKEDDIEKINVMKDFLKELITKKKIMIAYENDYFGDLFTNRIEYYNCFEILERIISESLNNKYNKETNENYVLSTLLDYSTITLINILNITNKLKCLIKGNINLNLLLDRYIIEIIEELELCKK
jgi:DNA polymerase III delta prime subunit